MKRLFLLSIITVLGFFGYQQISFAEPVGPCPCDTQNAGGVTGIEILDTVCPGGELAENATFILEPDFISVSLTDQDLGYTTREDSIGKPVFFCSIIAGEYSNGDDISPSDYESCRQHLIDSCDLKLLRPIPTISEWGLIATAGVLGIIGLIAVRRRRAVA